MSEKTSKTYDESRPLKYQFSKAELEAMAKQLADDCRAKQTKEAEAKGVAAQFKADIAIIDGKIASASEKISSGYEMRMIKCRTVIDYKRDKKTVARIDTGEVIEEGKIPDSERQVEMAVGK